MTSCTDSSAEATPTWRRARGVGVSQTVLVVSGPFGPGLAASQVVAAIARGLQAGALAPNVCALPAAGAGVQDARALLDALDFDARMRASRAVVICTRRLQERALAGSVTFEIATRARQSGVPVYAVAAENALEPFDARILDLQLVLQADSRRALAAAGQKLAAIV